MTKNIELIESVFYLLYGIVSLTDTIIRVKENNKLLKLNFIIKNYFNTYHFCNSNKEVYDILKKKYLPKENNINGEDVLKMIRYQVHYAKLQAIKVLECRTYKIFNPRMKEMKLLDDKIIELNKCLKEVSRIKYYKNRIFNKCMAYNSNTNTWYSIDVKYAYMFYFLYVNYTKLYINELNRFIIYVKQQNKQRNKKIKIQQIEGKCEYQQEGKITNC